MQKIVLTGGGSCGHILPSIALLPELHKHFDKIYYIGEADSLEQDIARENNLEFYTTPVIKLKRGKILCNLAIPFVLPKAVKQAKQLLIKLAPNVVFSKGGYVSLPTTLAAHSLGIPVVVHESDRTLGVANKLASYRAKRVLMPTLPPNCGLKYVAVANPLRQEILRPSPSKVISEHKLRPSKMNILVLGGSLGATAINTVIMGSLANLTDSYNIIHLTGKGKLVEHDKVGYYPVEYASNIGDYYAVADLVISRAGAGVVTELLSLGKRAILVPLPDDCSRGDQMLNAIDSGYTIIAQDELEPSRLIDTITECIATPPPTATYDHNTSKIITSEILQAMRI